MVNTIMYGQDAETMEKKAASETESLAKVDGFDILNPYQQFGMGTVSVRNNAMSMESLMPVEDRAVVTEEDKAFLALGTEGRFRANVKDFAQIYGRCEGKIFAGIQVKDNGTRIIRFAQQYRNGNFSGVTEIPQSEAIAYVAFVKQELALKKLRNATEQYKEYRSEMYDRAKRKALKIHDRLEDDYLGKLKAAEYLDINNIVLDILEVLDLLPEKHESHSQDTITAEAIYKEVIGFIRKYDYDNIRTFNNVHKNSYYCLSSYDIDAFLYELKTNDVAELSKKSFLNKLNDGAFLYLQDSSVGYQSMIEYPDSDGKPVREKFYCIFKPEYLEKLNNRSSSGEFAAI